MKIEEAELAYGKLLKSVAVRWSYGMGAVDYEDLEQEAELIIVKSAAKLRADGNPANYLAESMRRRCSRVKATEQRQVEIVSALMDVTALHSADPFSTPVEDAVIAKEQLRAAYAALDDRGRKVMRNVLYPTAPVIAAMRDRYSRGERRIRRPGSGTRGTTRGVTVDDLTAGLALPRSFVLRAVRRMRKLLEGHTDLPECAYSKSRRETITEGRQSMATRKSGLQTLIDRANELSIEWEGDPSAEELEEWIAEEEAKTAEATPPAAEAAPDGAEGNDDDCFGRSYDPEDESCKGCGEAEKCAAAMPAPGGKVDCEACEGTGKSSSGRRCAVCGGTGIIEQAPTTEAGSEDPAPQEAEVPAALAEFDGLDEKTLDRRYKGSELRAALKKVGVDCVGMKKPDLLAEVIARVSGEAPPEAAPSEDTDDSTTEGAEHGRLLVKARALGVEWEGEPAEDELREWIAEEEAKGGGSEDAPAEEPSLEDLIAEAEGLGIEWEGDPSEDELREWIAEEKEKTADAGEGDATPDIGELMAEAEALGIEWSGEPDIDELQAWIAEEKAAQGKAEDGPAQVYCEACKGTGKVGRKKCNVCDGAGTVDEEPLGPDPAPPEEKADAGGDCFGDPKLLDPECDDCKKCKVIKRCATAAGVKLSAAKKGTDDMAKKKQPAAKKAAEKKKAAVKQPTKKAAGKKAAKRVDTSADMTTVLNFCKRQKLAVESARGGAIGTIKKKSFWVGEVGNAIKLHTAAKLKSDEGSIGKVKTADETSFFGSMPNTARGNAKIIVAHLKALIG